MRARQPCPKTQKPAYTLRATPFCGENDLKKSKRKGKTKAGLTVCVTGAGAGVDNVREQEKLEARKMLEKPQNPQRPVYALLGSLSPTRTMAEKNDITNMARFYNELDFWQQPKNFDLQNVC
jgi:hypothetical protein